MLKKYDCGRDFMKRRLLGTFSLLTAITVLSGCNAVGEKTASISVIYGSATVISLLLLAGCCIVVKENRRWFTVLFSSVAVINAGYTFLSLSSSLEAALWANRTAYLGSVFLPLAMLMIILQVTNTKCKKRITAALFALSVIIFLIAASPGILPIYYKDVSFETVNGVGTLVKVYGPLHPLYLVYLVGYFAAMVAVIIRASVKKTLDTPSHAVVLAIAVFVNIGVWFIEQMTDIDFEMLSISYIISELFLLGVYLVMKENKRLKALVKEKTLGVTEESGQPTAADNVSDEAKESFKRGAEVLTPTERAIFEAYVEGKSTKVIMSELNIKENTLKFHNKNIYGKLGVSSRKQLVEIYKAINK